MKQIIRVKLCENTDSDKIHLHRVIKRPDTSTFIRKESLCGRHNRTDNHSELWKQGNMTNKQILIDLIPKLAKEDQEYVLCEWCILEILKE
jgi:hypothetical protein